MSKGRLLMMVSAFVLLALVLSLVTTIIPVTSRVEAGDLELFYDDGTAKEWVETTCNPCSDYQGVRFSLPGGLLSAAVTKVRFYLDPGSKGADVRIHIADGNNATVDLIPPVSYHADANIIGWHTVNLPGATVVGDFWVIFDRSPLDVNAARQTATLARDVWSDFKRSYTASSPHGFSVPSDKGDILLRATIANELHVGPDQPYKTIQSAVDAAVAGSHIVVHDGTYRENVVVGKELANLTIVSLNGSAVTTVQAKSSDQDVFAVAANGVTISGFTVTGADGSGKAGVSLSNANECNIASNVLWGNDSGVRLSALSASSNKNTIYKNTLYDNGEAIWIEGADNQVTGNSIYNNTATVGSAIRLGSVASGNLVHFNKITNNANAGQGSAAVYNENSAVTVNASLNWWGSASGPGNAVSNGVKSEPWLSVETIDVKGAITDDTNYTVDATAEASAKVVKTGTGTPTIWVASYSGNPAGIFPKSSIGKWIDVHFNDIGGVTQAEIRLYYTVGEITGLKEGSLRLYWWDSLNLKWVVCSDSGVNKVDHYIWARIKPTGTPSLNDLMGTPFAGGTAGGGFPWVWIVVVILALVVLAVVGRFAVRLMARRPRYE